MDDSYDDLLVPVGGGEAWTAGLEEAKKLASSLKADIHVLSVVDSGLRTSATYTTDSPKIQKKLEARAKDYIDRAKEQAGDFEPVTSIRTGIPDEQIIEYADEEDIDMIVMGIGGKRGFVKNLMGSVMDRVIRSAPIPVVTIRNQPSE